MATADPSIPSPSTRVLAMAAHAKEGKQIERRVRVVSRPVYTRRGGQEADALPGILLVEVQLVQTSPPTLGYQ